MGLRMVAALMTLMVVTSGCLSIKAYVDPQLPTVGYADLLARPEPRPVSLRVEFHRNGEPATPGATTAREAVRGVVAAGKGALTGLTFGAKGSQVTDGYVFTATFRAVGKQAVTRTYLLLDLQKEEQI